MSGQWTNFGENKILDAIRGGGLTLPADWSWAPGSAGDESGITEIVGLGLSRVTITRALSTMAGTQAAGSTVASSGSSHQTSNNSAWAFGTATGSGTMTHIGLYDANVAGNCWAWIPITALPFISGDAVSRAISSVKITFGLVGGMASYFCNKFIDLFFRGQAYTFPATLYPALYSAAPNDSGGGTEFSAASYARPALVASFANLSGTQGTGSTSASSGSSGRISNNVDINFNLPLTDWGTCVADGIKDAATAGNLLWWKARSAKSVAVADGAPQYAVDKLGITID